MIIRLTSVDAFENLLKRIKKHDFFCEEVNDTFFKFSVDTIKDGLRAAYDEWFLDVDYIHISDHPFIALSINYHLGSEIPTDADAFPE